MRDLKLFLLASAMVWITGCDTTHFVVKVDSLSAGSTPSKPSFILLPGNKDITPSDLQFQEFSNYIKRSLQAKGYNEATNFENASIAIFLSYGIGGPQDNQYSYSLPTFGQTGVSSSYTTGTVNSYGNYGTFSGTTTYTPTYGVTGSTSYSGSYTTYTRFLLLNAYDLETYKSSKQEKQIWKTTVTSTGSSSDLRLVFPVMVAASKDYIGSNTEKQVTISISETDDKVIEIKGLPKKQKIEE